MNKNTWPGGYRHAMLPEEHEAWNATHYPGTRQLCDLCDEPTGRCREDEMECNGYILCETCYLQCIGKYNVKTDS